MKSSREWEKIANEGAARANAFMSQFKDYEKTAAYHNRRAALDVRQAKSLAKDFSGSRKGGLDELRGIPGFTENEADIRKENVLRMAMIEAKRRSGLSQTAIARRMGIPQPNVSRIEHSETVSFNVFAEYLRACGFGFSMALKPMVPCV